MIWSIYFLAFPLLKWKLHEAKNCVCFGHMMDPEPGTQLKLKVNDDDEEEEDGF